MHVMRAEHSGGNSESKNYLVPLQVTLLLSLVFIRKQHLILPSNELGRYAALSWGIVVFIFIADLEVLEYPAIIAASALLVASAASYIERFLRKIGSDRRQLQQD